MNTNLSEPELRDLDVWIAEHVMGWKWFLFSAEKLRWCALLNPANEQDCSGGVAIDSPPEDIGEDLSHVPSFTLNRYEAMELLEKCVKAGSHDFDQPGAGVCDIVGITYNWGKWCVGYKGVYASDPSSQVAICLFAKKLFTSKGNSDLVVEFGC